MRQEKLLGLVAGTIVSTDKACTKVWEAMNRSRHAKTGMLCAKARRRERRKKR